MLIEQLDIQHFVSGLYIYVPPRLIREKFDSSVPTFEIALESAAVIDEDLGNLRESELGRVCCGCRAAGRGTPPGFGLKIIKVSRSFIRYADLSCQIPVVLVKG